MITEELLASIINGIESHGLRVVRVAMDTQVTHIYFFTRYPPRLGGAIVLSTEILATPPPHADAVIHRAVEVAIELIEDTRRAYPRIIPNVRQVEVESNDE